MKKKLLHIFLVFLLSSMLLNASAQNTSSSADTKVSLPPVQSEQKALKESLNKLVTQAILTNEQAATIFQQLNNEKPSSQKNQLDKLLSEGLINEAQAATIAKALKELPEGAFEIPDANAVYKQNGKIVSKTSQKYVGSRQNESGIIVSKNGSLSLTSSDITTSGSTSFESVSNFYGLNAGVLANAGSAIKLSDCTITTNGDGANAVFATGAGSVLTVANAKIHTSGDSSCALAATAKGTIRAEKIDITTLGDRSPALAADRVNGSVVVHSAVIKTAGQDSPGIYSIGNIEIENSAITAANSEAAIIEGRNSLMLNNTIISGAKLRGILLFQGYSGNLETGVSSFTMHGGSLTAKSGPAFYVTNIEGSIELTDAAVTAPSKRLIEVAADKWGTKGINGGKLTFTATRETLTGNIYCDNISTLTLSLKDNTTLTSTINAVRTSGSVHLILDNSSVWHVTGTSYLSSLTNADTTLANIHDNGFTVYYDARHAANQWLKGKTYSLKGGGKLAPVE